MTSESIKVQVVKFIQSDISETVGGQVSEQDLRSSFFELGVDSLDLVKLARGISRKFGVRLTMVDLLAENSSPLILGGVVAQRMGEGDRHESQVQ
ncbi:hypothetical protein CH249_01355 [Rhodococcus sp. 05-2255-3B1]|uniref:acyl carrier protein n=1 Tax=unclassified Rhodococcus (in: high G+C Gram-positive bacteria) TaxID=192944 RepID=UPI000B9AEFA2|nr:MULTISPECIES: acyl carrier protein [unclassified Rhodococcus (in: high G+C Gram-positive bacteria)]OZE13455.1 hypothetical protein CH250_06010 [Rhodococcus sp. 05-2255-3C]OZE15930.1 hypothetical protein CH249_01355 [Rhodococcus sp. 05-2255-3B1]OZE18969.1 hypothetical protein CH255_13380 [Rhodococcus sp. 05-2255-2A2]